MNANSANKKVKLQHQAGDNIEGDVIVTLQIVQMVVAHTNSAYCIRHLVIRFISLHRTLAYMIHGPD